MPHTHHSHSGTYCAHADPQSSLRDMFQTAVDRSMTVFAMTEHMPHGNEDMYPEEKEAGHTLESQTQRFDHYVAEAHRLRNTYYATGSIETAYTASPPDLPSKSPHERPMEVLIGFEAEWIRTSTNTLIQSLLTKHSTNIDFFLGSVHHVHTIPIDFDKVTYALARAACTPQTDEQLFLDYFDAQYNMLQTLKPRIVAHFDLIRLFADAPDQSWEAQPAVWSKIMRNLEVVASYAGLLEINTAAWRKGLADPYPRSEIVVKWLGMGGKLCLSDDSHAVGHVMTNYERLGRFLQGCGVKSVAHLRREEGEVMVREMDVRELGL